MFDTPTKNDFAVASRKIRFGENFSRGFREN